MTGLSIALVNLKPGTGKTTLAVWLAHVFAEAGHTVLLVDADPSGSALEWSDLAAMDPGLRDRLGRSAVLLHRCVTRANSTSNAGAALEGLGYDVLRTAVPRLEVYAQSSGIPVPARGLVSGAAPRAISPGDALPSGRVAL
jgi:KaiC/GvpD/RAD55 family RecA-like ATPase